MPTYKVCDSSVREKALEIMTRFPAHKELLDAKVKIDFVFAFGDRDDNNNLINDAITFRGFRALGLSRIIKLKDRAKGQGDAEILIDHDWWEETASEDEQDALLDHELTHLQLAKTAGGKFKFDDLMRPVLKMKKHDAEIGWFIDVAKRHGNASIERKQARSIMEMHGQYLWPEIYNVAENQGRFAKLEVALT